MTLPFRLMLVTDDGPDLAARLERALTIRARIPVAVQLRMKRANLRELQDMATRVRSLTRARGLPLFINGRVDVALEVEADGVHLPAKGISIAVARAFMPASTCIGVSCHTADEVAAASQEGANYVLLSPIRKVEGKAKPLGIEGFAAIARTTSLPVLALGGITLPDVAALRAAGAAGIAVMRSVMLAADPAAMLGTFCDAWHGHAP